MSEVLEAQRQLTTEWNTLQNCWENVRSQWRDPMGDKFEREFWRQFDETLPVFIKLLEDLDATVEESLQGLDEL